MKEIKRDIYLNRLITRKGNGMVKIVTGIRRCGKSYLLFKLFKNHLITSGVSEDRIIELALDEDINIKYRNPDCLSEYLRSKITNNSDMFYILLDEAQLAITDKELKSKEPIKLYGILNGLLRRDNVDVYITGSNSKFLSSDVMTEFRGRGDEVRVFPLTFSEFMQVYEGDKYSAWREYYTFGGLPFVLSKKTPEEKSKYLSDLFKFIYLQDIVERNNVHNGEALSILTDVLASGIGALTNPTKIANTFESNGQKISSATIYSYLGYLENAFIISPALRYDVKGRKYISTTKKYYFVDSGLRNARLNFRQIEEPHIMENIIYNELLVRGYDIDIGMVEVIEKDKNGAKHQKQLEIDFVCNLGSKRYYIQSALTLFVADKNVQENRPLRRIDDNFKKIIITGDNIIPHYNDEGILIVNLYDFLLNSNIMDF